jgi:hypothetical protein
MMIGGSLLAVLPKGFFSWPIASVGSLDKEVAPMIVKDEGERKRRRGKDGSGGSTTPTLISPLRGVSRNDVATDLEDNCPRPKKRLRERTVLTCVPSLVDVSTAEDKQEKETSDLLRIVPEEVIAHCLSFLGTADDRFALQTTCKSFRNISNSDSMLEKLNICGNNETGKKGIIQDTDTPSIAAATLAPFARAGNLEALYM